MNILNDKNQLDTISKPEIEQVQQEQSSKLYTEEELRLNLIYCVSELMTNPKTTSEEMKIWNDKTNEWFNQNKKK